jgi:L-lactate dehydrogenase complex protein LldG
VSPREEILARIRAANAGGRANGANGGVNGAGLASEYAAIPRDYLRAHYETAGTDVVALFAERAADYRAVVERVAAAGRNRGDRR